MTIAFLNSTILFLFLVEGFWNKNALTSPVGTDGKYIRLSPLLILLYAASAQCTYSINMYSCDFSKHERSFCRRNEDFRLQLIIASYIQWLLVFLVCKWFQWKRTLPKNLISICLANLKTGQTLVERMYLNTRNVEWFCWPTKLEIRVRNVPVIFTNSELRSGYFRGMLKMDVDTVSSNQTTVHNTHKVLDVRCCNG